MIPLKAAAEPVSAAVRLLPILLLPTGAPVLQPSHGSPFPPFFPP